PQDGPDVQQAVTQAIAGLSERKVQFTYTDVLARTVGILPPENGVIDRARAGIDAAISREQLIPLDREQGREVQIIAADRRSQMNLKQDERLSGELITGRRQLREGMTFTPGSTVIVDQGEKLSLKETLTLLDGAARHNVQVLVTDSGQRTGTGSALMAMKDAGVNTYRWQGGQQTPATV
ncbi:ssDNA-binding domain-containing protein, partial [Salmonella enterica]|uniref:ssDNA-binding domain-containing protein n=1 Tax=Salmonella enterica TaxID=28901 RepID=UPI001592140C